MKKLSAWFCLLLSVLCPLFASAQAPSLINYQGRLLNGTNLVNGSVGLSLRLFDASAAGTMLFEDSNTVSVTDGLYSTLLGDHATFGTLDAALGGSNVWIEVAVNGAALSPRERLVAAAFAVKAQQALVFTGAVLDSQLSTNIARLNGTNQTFDGPVAFTSVSNTFTGTFSGSGAGITNISVESLTADQLVVVAWGDNGSGRATVPAGATGVVAIAAGATHSLALRSDGTVLAWGNNNNGQATVPANATGVTAIAAGGNHNLALRADGTVVAWGLGTNDLNDGTHEGQAIVPATATNVVAIAAGGVQSLALRADGSLIAWGLNTAGLTNIPLAATGVTAVACGYWHNLVLRSDGTVIAWGQGGLGQILVPATATGVVAIAAGQYHNLALRSDGTVIAWGLGTNDLNDGQREGQAIVPAGATGVVAIAGGEFHSLALRSDGTVLAWGKNNAGQTSVPVTATGVVAIAAGWSHNLARQTGPGSVRLARLDAGTNVFAGTVSASAFVGNGAALTNVGAVSLAPDVLTNISSRLASNVWAAADAARIAADVALSNSVASLQTNVSARLASNVWAAADAARIAADMALSNSVASLQTNVSVRLDSNVWAAVQTNLALRSGTNLFVGANTFTGTTTVVGTFLGSPPYIKVAETQSKGTDAGANNATTNNFRDLNTELVDTHSLATLSGGNLTLPAGTYQCRISAPAYRVDEHQIRLRVVNGATLLYGTSEFSDDTLNPGVQSRSWIDGQITLAGTSTLTIQHYTALIKTVNGLGLAANAAWTDSSPVEVYTVAEFWKIK